MEVDPSNKLAAAYVALTFVGQVLVWFEGDQTNAQLNFFGLLVASVLLAGSIAFKGPNTGLLRATGTFFLVWNIERCVCLLPPTSSSPLWSDDRMNTQYAGGLMVIIGSLISLVASYLDGFSAPAANVRSRILSIRGAAFLLAAAFLLIASAVQWSWSQLCSPTGRPSAYPVTNGVLVIIAFIFIVAIVYGDNNSTTISCFLAATVLLMLGLGDPLFDSDAQWASQSNFRDKWKAAKGLTFIGAVILLLAVVFTSQRSARSFAALPGDLVAVALAIGGAVCVFVRQPVGASNRLSSDINYPAAYAIVVTYLNLLQGLFGLDACKHIATFFAAVTLYDFDNGSVNTTGYMRGGLILCQIAVLLSVFLKAFPLDKPLTAYINTQHKVAIGFAVAWGQLAMLRVPNNYSVCALLSIITYKALSSGCGTWGHTAFYILSYFGIVGSFPLTAGGQVFATSALNDYVNTLAFLTSVYFLVFFADAGSPIATAFVPPEPQESGVVVVLTQEQVKVAQQENPLAPTESS